MDAQPVTIRLSLDVSLEDRGDHWAALIEQIGTRVYAEDEQAAWKRANELVNFMVSSFQKHATLDDFRKYLDRHSIQHSVEIVGAENVRSARPSRRYRLEQPLAFAV